MTLRIDWRNVGGAPDPTTTDLRPPLKPVATPGRHTAPLCLRVFALPFTVSLSSRRSPYACLSVCLSYVRIIIQVSLFLFVLRFFSMETLLICLSPSSVVCLSLYHSLFTSSARPLVCSFRTPSDCCWYP